MLTLEDASSQLSAYLRDLDSDTQINMACERLLSFGKYKGLTTVLYLRVYEDGSLTLPQDYETLLGARLNGIPQRLHDPWYQFVPRGNAVNIFADPQVSSIDLGEGFVAFRDVSLATDLRMASAGGDSAKTFTVTVRTSEDEGIATESTTVSGTLGAFGTSLGAGSTFFQITAFSKERTAAAVAIEGLINGSWVEVARFAPRDQDVNLRRYSMPQAVEGDILAAFCKKRFRPALHPSDPVAIESIYVLRLALEALSFESEGDLAKAAEYWGAAKKALDDALSEHRGSATRTVPTICRATGGSKLRALR